MISGVVLPPQLHRVFKRLPTALRHMPVKTPRGFAIVEASPSSTHGNLVGMLRLHLGIEAFEVISSPIAAVRCPSAFPRIDPRVKPIERRGEQRGTGVVFVDKQWRRIPLIDCHTHAVPVGMGSLRKN